MPNQTDVLCALTFEPENHERACARRRYSDDDYVDDDCDYDCDDDDAAGDMILLIMVNFDTECSANSACARRGDGDDDRQDGDDQ